MTTKEQERKALEQIRKIVDGLGENSYLSMAFEGVWEVAEENIENDFGCSMKQQIDELLKVRQENMVALQKANETIKRHEESMKFMGAEYNTAMETVKKLNSRAALAEETMQQERERANKAWAKVEELKKELEDAKAEAKDLADQAGQLRRNGMDEADKLFDAQAKVQEQEAEILKLKAKLYDLIVKD